MNQHFRGVVWPRETIGKQHRYVVVGMLVTDEPIPELEANQIVLDGHAAGMAEAVATIMQKPSTFRGDANSVLCGLERLVDE
jgi:hypothetical protein